jgi:RHS repeat-associated protein
MGIADQATSVGTVIAKGAQNASTMAPQTSAFDVWSHSYDGLSASMRDFANDPIGSLQNRTAQEARMREAMGPEHWESNSAGAVTDSISAQFSALGDSTDAISEAQGALATVGASFAFLTGVEQMLSTALSVIPFPAFPAIRILDMDVGLPHAHSHPPNLTPPNPVPVPLPSTGPVIPIPILSGATQTLINGMPAARCGDMGLGIWCGGYFPMYEVFLGSSNVWIEGARAGRIACDITKHCIFTTPKPSDMPIGPMIGLTCSSSGNVMIGGVPMPSLLSLGIGAAMKGLGALLKKGASAFSRLLAPIGRRVGDALDSVKCFLKRTINGAEPVNFVTGEVFVEQQDFSLPGLIPLEWKRYYGSQIGRRGLCGYGWSTPADARLVFEEDGVVVFNDGGGWSRIFPHVPGHEPVLEFAEGATLSRTPDDFVVELKTGLCYHFHHPGTPFAEILVDRIADRCGNYIRYLRDHNGLREIVESSGRRITVISERGLIRAMHLRLPNQDETLPLVRYEYSEQDELNIVYDAHEQPYRFRYEGHLLVEHTDRNGLSFYYAYAGHGHTARCYHAWGDHGLYDYQFDFDPVTRNVKVIDSLGHASTFQLNDRNLPVREIDPIGGITLYEYDSIGRATAVVDPVGNRTEYAYDERGNLLKLTRPDGKSIETEFNAANKATRITDPNGAVWQQEWDARGLLTRQISPLGAESRYEYDGRGQLVRFVNPMGTRTRLSFDNVGNLACLTDAMDHITAFAYDVLGNVIGKTDPLGPTTRYAYDAKSRLTQAVLPSGAKITCAYDHEDNLIRYLDENGAETRLEYFGLGEIKRRIQPDGHAVEYHYDTEERLIGVTNQRGERYELKRDPLGRIIEEVDYWGQPRNYNYNPAGHLCESTDPLGRLISFETDPLGRIVNKSLFDADGTQTGSEIFAYDANGNLVTAGNADIKIERKFDAEGRLIEETQGETFTIRHGYDPNGNRIEREVILAGDNGTHTSVVRYGYDRLDQAVSVQIGVNNPIQIQRNALGQITTERLSPALRRELDYSPDGYLTRQQVTYSGSRLFDSAYEYDRAGNLIEKRDSRYGVDRYTYDPLGRLVSHLDPQHKLKQYLNDPAGDRLRTHVSETSIHTEQDSETLWSREGEYEGTYYRFDRAGNLVERKDPSTYCTFEWDGNQRLRRSTTNGQATDYQYDPLGRRVSKTTGERRTLFYWDVDALVMDLMDWIAKNGNASAAQIRQWVYYPETFEPLAMERTLANKQRSVYIYQNDPNGCPTRMLEADGRVVWGTQYSAWGKVDRLHVKQVDNPIRLQGQYADRETGLYYNRHRYYEPYIGQFIHQDPIGLFGGENNYAYAPNPIGWVDPLGLECTVKLYRGVNEANAAYLSALKGIARPNRRWWQFWRPKSTPLQHNIAPGGTLDSPYTSWTTDPAVAENFALRPGGRGVVIEAQVPISRTTPSPNLKEVSLKQSPGTVVSESEVLVRGTVRGSTREVGI